MGGVEGAVGVLEEGRSGAAVVPDSGEVEDGEEEGGSGEVVEADCFGEALDG